MGKNHLPGIVAAYLDRIREIHASNKHTPELSYRSALENLLSAVAESLDPAITITAELADSGAGRPDFGFFDRKSGNSRGVAEVKPLTDDVPLTADGAQVSRYWKQYGTVLVTNYRDFLLVSRNGGPKPRIESRCTLAPDAESFFHAKPHTLAAEKADELIDFLTSVFRRQAPITRPRDLADDLARHAREARRRLDHHSTDALAPLQHAMEDALGLHFDDKEGQHFFRSSLVQTLFYGLFSAWMLWRDSRSPTPVGSARAAQNGAISETPSTAARADHSPARDGSASSDRPFDWRSASEFLPLPLIGDLYEEIARPKRLADLDLREPLEWATNSLNNVVPDEFFKHFKEDHAITLFYEPFLQSFDPDLRKQLGVWYTPTEIVQYMVGRVDQLLRSELGIENGLADENVFILDPAAGTGSYLLEVARSIHKTLLAQGHGALAASETRKALCSRVFGFEILPAPYVIAHLQLAILLRELGTKLAPTQRAGVYLTNALTGWEPPKGAKQTLAFHFLQEEQEAARKVKREAPILVILGNPPYNRFAGVAEDEEADLIEPYKRDLYEKWGVRKQLLDDLYIRFFRLAEKRITEASGKGVVCYISNYSWLDGISHPIMRERLLHNFSDIWIDNCNGDKYKTGKRTPDGRPDESMFTTDEHRVGIQIGTAIAFLARREGHEAKSKQIAHVHYRELWGTGNSKRAQLLELLDAADADSQYQTIAPIANARWAIAKSIAGDTNGYATWPNLCEVLPTHYSGLNENRQGALISDDRSVLKKRIEAYLDSHVSDDEIAQICPPLMEDAARFDAAETRHALLQARETYKESNLVRLAYRPFDDLWVYWVGQTKLLNEKRAEFFEQAWRGNLFLSASQKARKGGCNLPTIVDKFGDLHLQDPWSQYFPLYIRQTEGFRAGSNDPNTNHAILGKLCEVAGCSMFASDGHTLAKTAIAFAESLFFHILSVLWSPAYRKENEAALRQDWPRIPIPADPELLKSSASLGRQLADLLLPDKPVPFVTTGHLRPELRDLAIPSKLDGSPIDEPADTRVTAGWGFRGQKNAVMCGRGRCLPHSASSSTLDPSPQTLDPASLDIYLNDQVYWSNVPADVWAMTIGGYPVIKKWLSYREYKVLGRALRLDELTYITHVVRRLKAILLLSPALDSNYRAAASSPQLSF